MTHQERMEKLARDILGFYFCNKDMEASWMPEVRGRLVDALLTVFQEGYQAALAQREASPVEERDRAREIIDAWDVKHWGRKPIADTSFQYRTREDLIVSFAQAIANARAEGKKSGAIEKL